MASTTPARQPTAGTLAAAGMDAVALLKSDHRRMTDCFEEFNSAGSNVCKQDLATEACRAMLAHIALEEEIFYPALRQASCDYVTYQNVLQAHATTQRLIDEVMRSSPVDEFFDSKVRILADAIAQHIDEEERPGGTFAQAKESDIDLQSLGYQLQARHAVLNRAHIAAS